VALAKHREKKRRTRAKARAARWSGRRRR